MTPLQRAPRGRELPHPGTDARCSRSYGRGAAPCAQLPSAHGASPEPRSRSAVGGSVVRQMVAARVVARALLAGPPLGVTLLEHVLEVAPRLLVVLLGCGLASSAHGAPPSARSHRARVGEPLGRATERRIRTGGLRGTSDAPNLKSSCRPAGSGGIRWVTRPPVGRTRRMRADGWPRLVPSHPRSSTCHGPARRPDRCSPDLARLTRGADNHPPAE